MNHSIHRPVALVTMLLLAQFGDAQGRNNNWLEYGTWMSFTEDEPTLQADPPTWQIGASLSDTAGQLRVYVGSYGTLGGLRGPDHALADNHPDQSLFSGAGDLHRTLFVPKPGEPEHAFLLYNRTFYIAGTEYNRMGWLEVDLSQAHPTVLVPEFTWFASDAARKRLVVPHANGSDYWLIVQPIGTNLYHAHRITGSGVDPDPVVSTAGTSMPNGWKYGKLIPASQGDRFASVSESLNYNWADTTCTIAEVFHFDPATGEVEHELTLPALRRVVGIEFSPSGRFLYVTELSTPPGQNNPKTRKLFQYDLDASDAVGSRALIHAYSFIDVNLSALNALALGPDGRIYQAPDLDGTALGIIRSPDELGAACDYAHDSFTCLNVIYSLPAPMKRYHDDSLTVANGLRPRDAVAALRVVPNPSHDRIRLLHAPSAASTFVLRDATGRVAISGPLDPEGINLGGLSSGCYLAEVLDTHGVHVGVERVVKE